MKVPATMTASDRVSSPKASVATGPDASAGIFPPEEKGRPVAASLPLAAFGTAKSEAVTAVGAVSMAGFTPIERSSVAEQVAKKLLDLVRSKNLKPGSQLPTERELALSMQVSRPSVREALRGLQILGVIKTRQGGGLYVTSLEAADLLGPLQLLITLSEENVSALYESRRLIDGGMGRLAAERITEPAIDRLKSLLVAQEHLLNDPIAFRVSDLEFHRTIAEVTGNPFLVRVSTSLYVLGMEYRRIAAETPGVLNQSFADHHVIVAALEAHDGAAAEAAMVRHMSNVHASTLAAMESQK